ncbi:MAG: low molecular weight protein-tyrosine-phosphatase [Arachnia propionica]|uniref:low molecular weight protein-tyrosine-phosphatase n=1 Tax=Arachnia propionica TaxID=1750 RepID=UPI00270FA9AC|nr:low molecular weight protein-tyrosine-phosphatase [Arachnia propionica]
MRKLLFVCWGNICRSPMGERVARRMSEDRGLDVVVASVGISSEEVGNPIDRRAAKVLTDAGYDASGHRARRVTVADLEEADLVVAAETTHLSRLRQIHPEGTYALLNDFNPGMAPGTDLQDPWYGPASGFTETLADIEAAMPGILDRLAR